MQCLIAQKKGPLFAPEQVSLQTGGRAEFFNPLFLPTFPRYHESIFDLDLDILVQAFYSVVYSLEPP